MTDDYKEQLLDYITGNVDVETGVNKPTIVEDSTIIEYDNTDLINEMLVSSGYVESVGEVPTAEFREIGRIYFTNTDKTIVYGNMMMLDSSKPVQGAMIVADENNKYIGWVTQYDSGTTFSEFSTLRADENDLIYGIDYDRSTQKNRFIMLNDVISSYLTYSEYKCILRKSYFFPNDYTSITIVDTYKEYGSSNYLFIGQVQSGTTYYPVIVTVKVNVGEENEWNKYNNNSQAIEYISVYNKKYSSYCLWQNDTVDLVFSCPNRYVQKYLEYSFNGTSITLNKNINCYGIETIDIVDKNNIYIITSDVGATIDVDFNKVNNSTIDTIYTQIIEDNTITPHIESYVTNELFFGLVSYRDYNGFSDTIYSIIDDEIYYTSVENTYSLKNLFVRNQFNLYKIQYWAKDPDTVSYMDYYYLGSCSLDYNSLNYNGQSYSDYNSLIAHKGTLYHNGDLIFSRNLYNKTTLNNTTVSTVEIPNNMLNDTEITSENLFSETNLNMIEDNQIITKNVYETVFINFINTINVIDEDTNTPYINSAIKVNNSINTGTQTSYENSACTKYRINYTDTTTQVNNLEWLPINKYNKTTQITFYADKNITSIDLLSNDETIVYLNIPLEVEIGNYYLISQKMRTGDKPIPVQLQYNNEDINYNNQPVMVYVEE